MRSVKWQGYQPLALVSQTSPRAPDDEMVGAWAVSVKFKIDEGVTIRMLTIVICILVVLSLAID